MEAFETVGLAVFAGMALLLAVIGLYGVLSYGVNQRMREFGVRVALGAAPRDLAKAVLAETGRIVTVGVVCGAITALVAARVIRASLFGIGPSDPPTFVFVIVTVVVVAFAASLAPALRAMRVDPVRVIAAE